MKTTIDTNTIATVFEGNMSIEDMMESHAILICNGFDMENHALVKHVRLPFCNVKITINAVYRNDGDIMVSYFDDTDFGGETTQDFYTEKLTNLVNHNN